MLEMLSSSIVFLAVAILLVAAVSPAHAGLLPGKAGGLELQAQGVRKKGPLKVYALGLYSPSDVFDAPDEASLWSKLRLSKSGSGARGIVCVLTFKVSAQKMSGALIDSLKPRFKGPSSALDALSDKIVEGCSGGGGKGTVFEFLCLSKDKIQVSVNGNDQGVVEASNVGGAFADIYLDEKGVSPTLKVDILQKWKGE
mmetsp:Transcript_19173/g.38337  ORF Transcript_19173/g.38337 Transcript_19173/m.38337 type:complete len:198 (-) Transcript_19173:44-637(-)